MMWGKHFSTVDPTLDVIILAAADRMLNYQIQLISPVYKVSVVISNTQIHANFPFQLVSA